MPRRSENYGHEQILEYIDLYRKSNLSQKEFCEHHNINISTLVSWLRRDRLKPKKDISIIPIESVFVEKSPRECRLKFPSGIELAFDSDSNIKLIASLITEYRKCN